MNMILRSIPLSPLICMPLPLVTTYKALGFDIADRPNTFLLFEKESILPLNTKLTDEDVECITTSFVDIIKNL